MTETKNQPRLMFGYNPGLPPDATCAWGARLILNPDGRVDFLSDRQSTYKADGHEEGAKALLAHLDAALPIKPMKRLIEAHEFSRTENREVVLYEDPAVVVKANPMASYGYVYVVAYPKRTAP